MSPLRKVALKFSRDEKIENADRDVEKISFLLDERKIRVLYHRDRGRVTSASRLYSKDGKIKGFQADPFSKKPSPQELLDDFQRFTSQEKDCLLKIREVDREMTDMLKVNDCLGLPQTREEEEKTIELEYSTYDVRKNPKRVSRSNGDQSKEDPKDFLSIFLKNAIESGKEINPESVSQIYQQCVRAYKERLQAKERLILSRLDKETRIIRKRQTQLNKNPDMDKEEEDELMKYIHEASFRKRILEKRLARVTRSVV